MKRSKRIGPPRDPLIDEVRAIRKALWKGWNNDLATGIAAMREIELANAHRLVTPRKKRTARKKG